MRPLLLIALLTRLHSAHIILFKCHILNKEHSVYVMTRSCIPPLLFSPFTQAPIACLNCVGLVAKYDGSMVRADDEYNKNTAEIPIDCLQTQDCIKRCSACRGQNYPGIYTIAHIIKHCAINLWKHYAIVHYIIYLFIYWYRDWCALDQSLPMTLIVWECSLALFVLSMCRCHRATVRWMVTMVTMVWRESQVEPFCVSVWRFWPAVCWRSTKAFNCTQCTLACAAKSIR
jgi:hypothetical protein